MNAHSLIKTELRGDVCCVRLRNSRLEEREIHQLGEELIALCIEDGCRNIALSLGPEPPDCLYSVFLAKLITLRNTLAKAGGKLVLCELAPVAYSVFEACLLNREFTFAADFDAAVPLFGTTTQS